MHCKFLLLHDTRDIWGRPLGGEPPLTEIPDDLNIYECGSELRLRIYPYRSDLSWLNEAIVVDAYTDRDGVMVSFIAELMWEGYRLESIHKHDPTLIATRGIILKADGSYEQSETRYVEETDPCTCL